MPKPSLDDLRDRRTLLTNAHASAYSRVVLHPGNEAVRNALTLADEALTAFDKAHPEIRERHFESLAFLRGIFANHGIDDVSDEEVQQCNDNAGYCGRTAIAWAHYYAFAMSQERAVEAKAAEDEHHGRYGDDA